MDIISDKKLKKGGNVVIFTDWKKISYIIEELEKNNIEIKDLIRIEKAIQYLEIEIDVL